MITHSQQQLAILNWFQIGRGNAVVRARAGSGKTYTITQGLNKANASSALYAVFNKRNAEEACGKITNKNVTVKTLHAIGYGFILANWKGVRANAYCEFGRIKQLFPDAPAQVIFQTSRLVSYLKNTFINPDKKQVMDTIILRGIEVGKHATEWTNDKLADVALESLELATKYSKEISFDDMVWLSTRMGWVRPGYMLCVIDEAQDANEIQLKMIADCCMPGGRVCIVGDDLQCIYNFRGAMQSGIDAYKEILNAKEFPLTTSYRCPRSVIALAQAYAPDIQAKPDAIEGEIFSINHDKMLNDIKVGEIILSRTNAALTKSCLALLRKNKPAYIVGRDVAKLLVNLIESFETNDINEFYTKLDAWLAIKQANVNSWNSSAVANAQDTHETIRAISETCLTVEDVKTKINKLFLDSEYVKVPSVILSTVHKSKGGQWASVYRLTWTFNSRKGAQSQAEIQEERNIAYVCISRTENKLINVSEA